MTNIEETLCEVMATSNIDEVVNTRPGSASSSSGQDTNEDGSSTPPSVRKTRSSGPLSINKVFDSINKTTRRSTRRNNFLAASESEVSRPRIGADFQAEIPTIIQSKSDEKAGPSCNELMWTPTDLTTEFDLYCEIARVCRRVSIDVAMKHFFDRGFSLEKTLVDFERLPIPDSIQWSKSDFKLLIRKVTQNRRLNVIQKHFAELGKTGAQIVEKRYELFHQLCYGPSRWLCPKLRNCTTEKPITYREECDNCATELYKSLRDNMSAGKERKLCNACQLYEQITGKLRPFSTPISHDELIKKGLEKNEDYKSDDSEDEHYDCFTQVDLDERFKPVEWAMEEEEQCVRSFRKHGLNFNLVAEDLKNKTERQVERFYMLNRHRYSIDMIIACSEKERETPPLPVRPRRSREEDRTPTPVGEDSVVDSNAKKSQVQEPSTSQASL